MHKLHNELHFLLEEWKSEKLMPKCMIKIICYTPEKSKTSTKSQINFEKMHRVVKSKQSVENYKLIWYEHRLKKTNKKLFWKKFFF